MKAPAVKVPAPEDFRSGLRSAAVSARVGRWLGICFAGSIGTSAPNVVDGGGAGCVGHGA